MAKETEAGTIAVLILMAGINGYCWILIFLFAGFKISRKMRLKKKKEVIGKK